MTLYILAPNNVLLGTLVDHDRGWKFIPNTSSRSVSRRFWPQAEDAIPAWAKSMHSETLTHEEWSVRRSQQRACAHDWQSSGYLTDKCAKCGEERA